MLGGYLFHVVGFPIQLLAEGFSDKVWSMKDSSCKERHEIRKGQLLRLGAAQVEVVWMIWQGYKRLQFWRLPLGPLCVTYTPQIKLY